MKHPETRLHLILYGRVQGVGFRAFIRHQARTLDLNGGVWNRRDGAVEIEAAGPAVALSRLLDAARQGPPGSRVDEVQELEPVLTDLPSPFRVL